LQPIAGARNRARGVLLGQFIGDALGTTVEFSSPQDIKRRFPDDLKDIVGGGPFHVHPGQVTDDGELALALARTLVAHGWDLDARARAYAAWYNSGPFDIGGTTQAAFGGWRDDVVAATLLARAQSRNGAPDQQANGALMRVSPVAIYGASLDPTELAERAREDARFSHPSPVCQASNAAFVRAIQVGLAGGAPADGYHAAREIVADCEEVVTALAQIDEQPQCHGSAQGWVLIALRNAFHMLMHEPGFEQALVRTVMAGGDTDTNACITGSLLGAFCGLDGIPPRWIVKVLACRTGRAEAYQTADAISLADTLLEGGSLALLRHPQAAAAGAAERRQGARGSSEAGSRPPGRSRGERAVDARAGSHVRTSETDPIRVDWLPDQRTPGKVGITIAPGKHSVSLHSSGRWERDLGKDLEALANEWKTHVLLCLLESRDLRRLQIPDLVKRAAVHGVELISFPIRDGSVPRDTASVRGLVATMGHHTREGKNVVVQCEGGLGRSGIIAGCYLAAEGFNVRDVFEMLHRTRGQNCPETEEQRQFIRDFAREVNR